MGGAVKSFVVGVGKMALKGAVSGTVGSIPLIGGPLASWINSKYAVGTNAVGTIGVEVPEGEKTKIISTPAALISLVKANPEQAKKAGLTVDMIKEGVAEAKETAKAIGGKVKMPVEKCAVGKKEVKAKKPRTAAQLAATKRLVEMNRAKKNKK